MMQKGWTNIAFDKPGKKKKSRLHASCRCGANPAQCDESCCNYSQCIKKILLIGGITKLKHRYKDLIESHGYKCVYLDGYLKKGEKHLEEKIVRCDMVFCPVDCNSHNACASAKRLCRKHGKPIKILTSSGVTNVAKAVKSIN